MSKSAVMKLYALFGATNTLSPEPVKRWERKPTPETKADLVPGKRYLVNSGSNVLPGHEPLLYEYIGSTAGKHVFCTVCGGWIETYTAWQLKNADVKPYEEPTGKRRGRNAA